MFWINHFSVIYPRRVPDSDIYYQIGVYGTSAQKGYLVTVSQIFVIFSVLCPLFGHRVVKNVSGPPIFSVNPQYFLWTPNI